MQKLTINLLINQQFSAIKIIFDDHL